MLSALWVFTLFGCATAGGNNPPAASRNEASRLTNFDYVVLASLADAGRPISLATYAAASND